MSEETKPVSDEQSQTEVTEEKLVSQKAYLEQQRDMFKFKQRAKEAETAKAEYEAKLKAVEEEKMRENEQWKELSEKYKSELEEARQRELTIKQQTIQASKKSALKAELGNINDVYLVHANIDAIEVNEHGLPDQTSVLEVANQFRKEHSVLFQTSGSESATSIHSPVNSTAHTQIKSVGQMSLEEKLLKLRELKTQNS